MKIPTHSKKTLSTAALFLAAIIWGSSFFIVKNTVDVFAPPYLLAFRFTLGAILLGVIFHKHLRSVDFKAIVNGCLMGLFLFLGYSLQTIAIMYTTPGKNAFLTAVYCVIVPFLFWAVNKTRPDRYHLSAAVICITGIGFVCLRGDLTIGFGDLLTLICGFFYAAHIVVTAKITQTKDPIQMTVIQFACAAVLSWIVALSSEAFPTQITPGSLWGLLYLGIFATTIALLLQVVAQKHTHPSAASIILSLEAVFGVAFSMLFYGEQLTPQLCLGFVLIFVAIIVSETKLNFLKKSK